MANHPSFLARANELLAASVLALALGAMQVFIGGTRLVLALPIYALLGVAGLLAVFTSPRTKPAVARFCLCSAALFFGYVLLRAWFSPVPYLARADIFCILGGLIVYLAVAIVFTAAPWRMATLLSLVVLGLVQVGIGVIQFRDGNNFMLFSFLQRFDYGRRASGFYICPNHFAGLLEVLGIFCVAFVFWSRWPTWLKLLVAYAGAVCYAGLALTGSRGGYLSASVSLLLVGALTLIALRPAGGAIFLRAALGGAVLAALLAGVVLFGFSRSDYLSGRAQNVLDRKNVRPDLWRAALAQWQLQPALGTGSGTYLYYGRRFRAPGVQLDPVYAHNDYLHLLAEYGGVGMALFFVFLGAHLWQGGQSFQKLGPRRTAISSRLLSNNLALNIGGLGAVAAYAVHSVFDFNLHIPANVLLLAFVFGILANPGFERENKETSALRSPIYGRLALPLLALLLIVAALRYGRAEWFAERARTALRDERQVAATHWALQAVTLDEQNPETWFYLGESRVRRAEEIENPAARASFYRAALEPLQRARALVPNDETFLIALGRVYDALGRFAEAEWMFGAARDWDPRSVVVQKSYAAHLANWRGGSAGREPEPRLSLPDGSSPLPGPEERPAPERKQ